MIDPPVSRPRWLSRLHRPLWSWGLAVLAATPIVACGGNDDSSPEDSASGGSFSTGATSSQSGSSGMGGRSGSGASSGDGGKYGGGGIGGATLSLGNVDLVPYYEAGSAWESNATARAMVDALFAEVEAALRTSGSWDATIEVYLTDDNAGTANTYFDGSATTTIEGQSVKVVPAWAKIVLGAADDNGPANTAGEGFDFAVAFNVEDHADNPGLLRHELMHGLGAVNWLANPTMTVSGNTLGGLVPNSWVTASVYDLALVDRKGKPLLGDYDSDTKKFQVQSYDIEPTYTEWTDGSAGFSFRGVSDVGGTYDMPLMTTPNGNDAMLLLNEPTTLMSADAHPTWHHLAEPDRAYFRAMGYQLAP